MDEHDHRAPVDRTALLERLGGDEELFRDVVHLFIAECPERLAAIRAAIDQRDADRLKGEAHRLKGSAASLSADPLADAARALEQMGARERLDAVETAWECVSAEAERTLRALGVRPSNA